MAVPSPTSPIGSRLLSTSCCYRNASVCLCRGGASGMVGMEYGGGCCAVVSCCSLSSRPFVSRCLSSRVLPRPWPCRRPPLPSGRACCRRPAAIGTLASVCVAVGRRAWLGWSTAGGVAASPSSAPLSLACRRRHSAVGSQTSFGVVVRRRVFRVAIARSRQHRKWLK